MDFLSSHFKNLPCSASFTPSLLGLQEFRLTVGDNAVNAIMKGLSRRVRIGDEEDLKKLIAEWENEKRDCCFQGDVDEICSMKNTYIFAISYKHRQFEEVKKIKAEKRITSKMTEHDQALLLKTVGAMKNKHGIDDIILWCDQILRIKDPNVDVVSDSNVQWHQYGIFPYFAFPVLFLSTDISDDILDKRVWIRVERSIARMRLGFVLYDESRSSLCIQTRGMHGSSSVTVANALLSISQLLLCGYWEIQKDAVWKKDFYKMREWAFYISTTSSSIHHFPFMDKVRKTFNVDIIFNIVNFSVSHADTSFSPEEVIHTTDNYFYLKATSWNLNLMNDVTGIWDKKHSHLSHYMGTLHSAPEPYYSFSWWKDSSTGNMIGYMSTIGAAIAIFAEKVEDGFLLFRLHCDDVKYSFGDTVVDERIRKIFEECTSSISLQHEFRRDYKLCYCHRSLRQAPNLDCLQPVENKKLDILGGIWLPTPFAHVIGYLVDSKLIMSSSQESEQTIITEITVAAEKWNTFIKQTYPNFVHVYGNGITWIEGISDEIVSFGFLDYISRKLMIGEDRFSSSGYIKLRSKEDVIKEINRLSEEFRSSDIKIYVEELFNKSHIVQDNISTKEVAMFMLYGGFTSSLKHLQFCLFLTGVARSRGYYSTRISSLGRQVQVRVFNESEERRLFEKKLNGDQVTAIGFIDPRDKESTDKISNNVLCDRKKTAEIFPNSIRHFKDFGVVTVDMTPLTGDDNQARALQFYSGERSQIARQGSSSIMGHPIVGPLLASVESFRSSVAGESIFLDWMRAMRKATQEDEKYGITKNTRSQSERPRK